MALQRLFQDSFSRYIGWPAIRFQERLRPAKRKLASHFKEGLDFREQSVTWQNAQKEEWITNRLRTVVRRAAQETLYYKALFKNTGFDPDSNFSFEEFSRVPILNKEVLRMAGKGLISQNISSKDLLRDSSGGSTGEPVQIWLGPEDLGWHLSSHRFFMNKLGVTSGSRVAYLWGHHLDPGAKKSAIRTAISYFRNERWFDCFRLSEDILAEYHRQMQTFQPDCIVAYASALAEFAHFLEERKIKPDYPRKCIVTGAEKLFDSQRLLAERVFPTPIHERYGGRDAGLMGYQLNIPQSREFVVDWPNLMVEPETKDETGSDVLVTKLHADGMPMIRYRVGDVGVFPSDSRPGHPSFALQSVVGRSLDKIWKRNGSFLHGAQFPHLFKDFPVREFMVVQEEDYSVVIQVVPRASFSNQDRDSILKIVHKNLPDLSVTLNLVNSLTKTKANKWRPVISRVPQPEKGAQ